MSKCCAFREGVRVILFQNSKNQPSPAPTDWLTLLVGHVVFNCYNNGPRTSPKLVPPPIKSKPPSISLSSLSYSPGLLLRAVVVTRQPSRGPNVMAGSPIIGVSILWGWGGGSSGWFWASRRRPGGSYKGAWCERMGKRERERKRPVKNPSVFKSN